MIRDGEIAAAILRLAEASGPDASICPSEAAKDLSAEWRPLLGPVRRVAARLAQDGRIDILRKGRAIAPAEMKGVIRLRIRPESGA
jgi:Protein of unknown function (DUF3253)